MLLPEERETIILFDRSGSECKIYTADKTVMTRLDKLYPCIKQESFGDGELAKTYLTNKRYVSFRKDNSFNQAADNKTKRTITPEHLAKLQTARKQAKESK